MAKDYNQTLNLPATDFPMRASLPQREPETLSKWYEIEQYQKITKRNAGKPLYVLHDGPPYANGDIHMGHALNKLLKDFIVRYKNLSGYNAPYVPGWDMHGLPTELKAIKETGIDRKKVSPFELRKVCMKYADLYMNAQREQFKRLGGIGEWEKPYLTTAHEFEAKQVEVFGELAKKGYIYKGLRPVYWCPNDETALAEMEIEYSEDRVRSIYVRFAVTADSAGGVIHKFAGDAAAYLVIWTTTTWTLPGNMAICLGPDIEYSFVKLATGEVYIIASELCEQVMGKLGQGNYTVAGKCAGKELEYVKYQHPFLDRRSPVILGDHVTVETGTGCVHTAPGHGMEDFVVCRDFYPDIEVIVPVDPRGYMTAGAGPFAELSYTDANKAIEKALAGSGALVAAEEITHTYPHCWRCSEPILFRATEQWFASVEGIKDEAIKAARGVAWDPAWGQERMDSMIRDRGDWCISRQRLWGMPIPIFYCEDCGRPLYNERTLKAVSELFGREGSDSWYIRPAEEILPAGEKCGCGCGIFTKETDIMDVWFDSGSSHVAVLETRDYLANPADLYLEGNDQFRGWFQSSLLTSITTRERAPYKSVMVHGMVLDGEGKKMSKSLGNAIDPIEIASEYGADILRLWVSSVDFRNDVALSKDILKQLSEIYRKIRNTARYILSNTGDFDPDADMASSGNMPEIDRWALGRVNRLVRKVTDGYENHQYHMVFHAIHNFCVIDMSNFYLDVIKDRLYVEKADSPTRRAAQSAMYMILDRLTRMISVVLAFTAEEIWWNMPHMAADNKESVMLNDFPVYDPALDLPGELAAKWEKLLALREDAKKSLENARGDKVIGASLEASLEYCCGDQETYDFVKSVEPLLNTLMITSGASVVMGGESAKSAGSDNIPGLSIHVRKAAGEKCERCWTYGNVSDGLCRRCAAILAGL